MNWEEEKLVNCSETTKYHLILPKSFSLHYFFDFARSLVLSLVFLCSSADLIKYEEAKSLSNQSRKGGKTSLEEKRAFLFTKRVPFASIKNEWTSLNAEIYFHLNLYFIFTSLWQERRWQQQWPNISPVPRQTSLHAALVWKVIFIVISIVLLVSYECSTLSPTIIYGVRLFYWDWRPKNESQARLSYEISFLHLPLLCCLLCNRFNWTRATLKSEEEMLFMCSVSKGALLFLLIWFIGKGWRERKKVSEKSLRKSQTHERKARSSWIKFLMKMFFAVCALNYCRRQTLGGGWRGFEI